jgi:hypothetical protein
LRGRYIPAVAISVGVLALTMVNGANATTLSRRCGPTFEADGHGTLGTTWTLKSKHDDDGPGGSFVVGEEFEIHTNVAGQLWTITFADNGNVFFTGDDVSTVTGIRELHPTANIPGTNQHMTAHAVNHTTGEVIDAEVVDTPVPACGG